MVRSSYNLSLFVRQSEVYTYFIIENEDNDDARIKIGFSKKSEKRIKELQTGNSRKLAIIGWIESEDKSMEKIFIKIRSI